MSWWDRWFGWLFGSVSGASSHESAADGCSVNPATGLPMIGGCGGVDVEGNPYGVDLHSHDPLWDTSSFDDGWLSSGFDDGWSAFDSGSPGGSSWDD